MLDKPFLHTGTVGDVLYSIPAIRAMGGGKVILAYNDPMPIDIVGHPWGKVSLTEKACVALKELFDYQDCVSSCEVIDAKDADRADCIYLNSWRDNVTLYFGNSPLPERYFIIHSIYYDMTMPWMKAPQLIDTIKGLTSDQIEAVLHDPVVINFTNRYRNSHIDHSVLGEIENLVFVGLNDEYNSFVAKYRIECCHILASGFAQMASIISKSKAFIGNASCAWVMADALKIPRILEVYLLGDHSRPYGSDGYAAVNQQAYEYALNKILGLDFSNGGLEEG